MEEFKNSVISALHKIYPGLSRTREYGRDKFTHEGIDYYVTEGLSRTREYGSEK